MYIESVTQSKVWALCEMNAMVNKVHRIQSEYMKQFVGRKIYKAAGGMLEAVRKGLPVIPDVQPISIISNCSEYHVAWTVHVWFTNERGHTESMHKTAYVGYVRNGVLQSMAEAPEHRTDYTVEEVILREKEYKAASAALDAARSALIFH